MFSLFPEKDSGRRFHESPSAPEMVNTKWGKRWVVLTGYLSTSTYYIPRAASIVFMRDEYNKAKQHDMEGARNGVGATQHAAF